MTVCGIPAASKSSAQQNRERSARAALFFAARSETLLAAKNGGNTPVPPQTPKLQSRFRRNHQMDLRVIGWVNRL
jgi:hypothetical protein